MNSVITITGIGDHLQPEWLITFTGIRSQLRPRVGHAIQERQIRLFRNELERRSLECSVVGAWGECRGDDTDTRPGAFPDLSFEPLTVWNEEP